MGQVGGVGKVMKLTQEYLHELFDYRDGNLYWKISRNNFHAKIGDKAGGLGKNGYYRISIDSKRYYNHRLIFLYQYGYLPKYIDHIDNNPLNNKIGNLREVTHSQNHMNRKQNSRNASSQYKGVCWDKSNKVWIAQIQLNNIHKYLGGFKSEQKAALIYNNAATELFGEYTNLNQV